MSADLPVAVIGCGHLGTFHARLWRDLPGAELRLVVDTDAEKARALGEALGVAWSTEAGEARREAKAVSVATPTSTHHAVAGACLEAGLAVLVEKPLAATVAEGRALVDLAARRRLVLAVGHVERFNPAFRAAAARVTAPRFIEAHRLATFVPRALDVDVVLDLMIHDLDLSLALVRSPIEEIDAVGVPVLTAGEDIANARVRFANGAVANLTASRVSRERVRKIRLFSERRYLSIDLMERKVEEVVLEEEDAASPSASAGLLRAIATGASAATGRAEGEAESDPADDTAGKGSPAELLAYFEARRLRLRHDLRPFAEANPLRDELVDFLQAVRGGVLEGASGADGLRALEAAHAVRGRVHESLRRMGLPARSS